MEALGSRNQHRARAGGGAGVTTRTAACCCRQLTATCTGEPLYTAVCHCLECQRRTGSAFGAGAFYAVGSVKLEGAATSFVRIGDEGSHITFRFCPVCGTTISWENMPGLIAIAVGAFADPAFPAPRASMYHESRRHPWVAIETGAPLEKHG